ncbi:hypothetical protein CC86DRAFT_441937 [Ophiobolus disseminans]|uniref:Uncharacterized protein n=1 Tax=Ophiobolus disseminans TaxID=1469910 RepID=A0A6A7AJE5_9PLEO|nr:hypothetical protein CC86DRAFT_441937 [Ophiobolus disseminans]
MEASHSIVPLLQAVATIAPAMYTGFTFAYSNVVIPPMTTHAPPKLLAKQWLQAYQFAPVFVAPLIILGASSNALLAFYASALTSRAMALYVLAALANASIIPYTALYMEPGINGAGKWKVQELLRDEGFELDGIGQGTSKDTARESAKNWAMTVDMKTIAETWAKTNAWRYVITGFATVTRWNKTLTKRTRVSDHQLSYCKLSLTKASCSAISCCQDCMGNPSWPRLTRNELVTIISDYYVFLTKFYIPPSAIKYPPPGGWPNITAETTKDLGKSELVIDLIKHLPYIASAMASKHERAHDIHYKSEVVDYSILMPENFTIERITDGEESLQEWWDEMEEDKDEDEEESDDEDANHEDNWWNGDNPDHFQMTNMIVLAQGTESGGRHLILDVFKGNIYEDVNECNLLPSCGVEGFFADLREKFEKLDLVPTLSDMYEDEAAIDDENEQQFRKVWREYGWPGKGFRKEEALKAIQKCRERLGRD